MRLSILILILMCINSFGQVTVTSGDLLGVIGKISVLESDTTDFVNVSPGPAGENQIWDFSLTVMQSEEISIEFIEPQDSPYPDAFPNANFVQFFQFPEDTLEFYVFYEIDPAFIHILGIAFMADSLFVEQEEEDVAPLPLTYGTSWESVISDTLAFEGFMIITKDSTYSEVDAFGTIHVPAGSFESLRIRDNNTEYSQIFIDGILVSSDTTTRIEYEWITKDNFLAANMESQDGEMEPNFTVAQGFERLKSLTPTSIVDKQNLISPTGFELYQNYPNPFNPETVIKYQTSLTKNIRIDVYDLNGRWVTTLIDRQKSAGSYFTFWNGKNSDGLDVASGVYFYTLNIAGKKVQSRKMVLIR